MKQTLAFGVAASQGNWPAQEDGYFVDPQARVFALADGFGGRGRGDLAAKLALRELRGRAVAQPSPAGQRAAFAEINKIILEWNAKRAPGERGGCSAALVQVSGDGLVTATNCGTSAVVLVRRGACQVLLSPQAAPRAQSAGALMPDQALGLGIEISPESRVFAALPGDLLFLASGGLEWESTNFQAELLAQWGMHLPGGDMTQLAESLIRGASQDWNTTFLGLEIC